MIRQFEPMYFPHLLGESNVQVLMFNIGIPPEVPSEETSRIDMDVSKNRGTPKWMVYNGKPY